MKFFLRLLGYCCLMFCFTAFKTVAGDRTTLLKQVSFQEVLELPSVPSGESYRYGPHSSQYIQLWNAPVQPESAANIIFIHGGCWLEDYDVSHTYPASSALKDAGFNVWSIEYRRLGETGGDWPASLNDVKAALNFIHQRLNNKPVAVMGHSAGGHLALLATAKAEPAAKKVDAVIGLAAITDMVSYTQSEGSCNQAAVNLMKTAYTDISDYEDASPKAKDLHSNTWLIQGTADSIVPMIQTQGLSVSNEIIEGAGHFDLIHPHSTAWKAILQRLNKELNP